MNPIFNNPNGAMARTLAMYQQSLERSVERLASGQRINRASDDAVGLISSEGFRAILATLESEARSLQRADHVAATADGALSQVSDLLVEAESLVVANANTAGLSPEEREANQMQLDSILRTVDRIASSTTFAGTLLFDGSFSLSANGESVSIDNIAAEHLGLIETEDASYSLADLGSGRSLNIANGDVSEASETLNAARDQINHLRGRIGAFQTHTVHSRLSAIGETAQQVASANSEIRDADFAEEASGLVRTEILQYTALRVAALANSESKNVLNLLG